MARYIIYNYNKEKVESNGFKYFLIKTHYLDFNGKVLRKATTKYKVL